MSDAAILPGVRAVGPRGMPNWQIGALICVLLIYCVFAVVDRTLIAMLIDPIRETLGISDTQIGLLMGVAYAAAYGLGGLPMGYLVDRYPRKWILFSAVILWGLAEAACGMSSGFVMMFLARAGVGLFESPLHPSAHAIIADTVPRRRLATVMSIYSTGNLLGTGMALIIGGWVVNRLLHLNTVELPLIGHVRPWQFAFIITGLPGLLLALLILPFGEPPRYGHPGRPRASWSELWAFIRKRWQVVLTLSVVFGGMNIVVGSIVKWAPAYMSRHFKMNPAEYGLALGLAESLPAFVGLIAGGWIVDRWYASGRKDAHLTYYMWVLILTSPIVFWGMMSDRAGLFIASVALAKALTCNFLGIAAAQVQAISPPSMRGRLSGLFFLMVVAFFGTTFGALLPAVIAEKILHDTARVGHAIALTLAVFAPLAVVAILWGRRHVREAIAAVEQG
ncbi:MAG TPA: MFS transporter [Novosphingobium sp.]